MRKTLTRVGDSTGLIIDKPILQLLELRQGDEVEIDLIEEALVIRPVNRRRPTKAAEKQAKLAAIKARMHEDIGGTLRKLAK